MSIDLSLTIIAICSIFLVIFAIAALIAALRLLIVIRKATLSVEQKIHPILDETKKIANLTSTTAERVKNNIELTTPLFQSIGKISTLVNGTPNRLNSEMHDNTLNINFGSKKGKLGIADWAEFIASGIVILQKLRR